MASDYYNENGSAPRENFSCSSDARFCHRLCLRLWHSRRDFLLSTQHCKVEPASPLNDAPSRRTVAGPVVFVSILAALTGTKKSENTSDSFCFVIVHARMTTPLKGATIGQRCGTTLNRLPPRFPQCPTSGETGFVPVVSYQSQIL
jgi:hypothetical protein